MTAFGIVAAIGVANALGTGCLALAVRQSTVRRRPMLLRGAGAIGRRLRMKASHVDALMQSKQLPIFRLPGDPAPHATAAALTTGGGYGPIRRSSTWGRHPMTPGDAERVQRNGEIAAQIDALAELLSESLQTDPATVVVGDAVAGLGTLAHRISVDLLKLAGANGL